LAVLVKLLLKWLLGLGMKVIAADSFIPQVDVTVLFFDGQSITTTIVSQSLESLFKEADFITLHVLKTVILLVRKN
jgi:D-3-phosphoglycerate dehydrogenase